MCGRTSKGRLNPGLARRTRLYGFGYSVEGLGLGFTLLGLQLCSLGCFDELQRAKLYLNPKQLNFCEDACKEAPKP